MGKVNSKLPPPKQNPCITCEKIQEFFQQHDVRNYQDYLALDVDMINQIRTVCASCKGSVYAGYGSGSYKSDLVAWWLFDTVPGFSGTGKTSRFTTQDVERIKDMHDIEGKTWVEIAKAYHVHRTTIHRLMTGQTGKLKK